MEDILNGITEFFDQILAFFSMIGDFITHIFTSLLDLVKFVVMLPTALNISQYFIPSFIWVVAMSSISIALCVRLFGGPGGK